jgi:hypothetical protein
VLTVIVTIMRINTCSINSYCDNDGEVYMQLHAVLAAIVTIMPLTGRSICNFSSYCDNNRKVFLQCYQLV